MGDVFFPDLKVQVGTRDPAGAPNLGDYLSLSDFLAFSNQVLPVMGVNRYDSPGVADDDEVAVASQPITVDDLSVLHGSNGSSLDGCYVDSVMKGLASRAEL